jgi:small subunit ribosomal protein S4
MLKTKQFRYKPLYKKFISLKTNVQYRRRLLLLKFKKQKWQKLIVLLQRLQKRQKKNFKIYDLNRYNLPKIYNSFKLKYKIILQNKKKISLFYGNLLKNYLRKQINLLKCKKKYASKNLINFNTFFLSLIEKRLDVTLYRAHFVSSILAARQLILHKNIKVNDKIVTTYSYELKQGDLISINEKIHPLIYSNICNSHLWPLSPKYLYINYKTFEILFNGKIEFQNLSIFYPFWPNIYYLLRYFK